MLLDLFQILVVLLRAIFGRQRKEGSHPTLESTLSLRVALRDLDFNLHMNNSRYLARMDLGRWDLFLRTGLIRALLRARLNAVVVDLKIRYRRELRYGTRFELRTRFKGIEQRKLWVRQEFWRGKNLCAEADVGILILRKGKPVDARVFRDLLKELGYSSLQELPPDLKERPLQKIPF